MQCFLTLHHRFLWMFVMRTSWDKSAELFFRNQTVYICGPSIEGNLMELDWVADQLWYQHVTLPVRRGNNLLCWHKIGRGTRLVKTAWLDQYPSNVVHSIRTIGTKIPIYHLLPALVIKYFAFDVFISADRILLLEICLFGLVRL